MRAFWKVIFNRVPTLSLTKIQDFQNPHGNISRTCSEPVNVKI